VLFTSAEGGYVFTSVCLSVYLSVRQITEKVVNGFLGGIGHGPATNEFSFGDNPDHRTDPGVRSLKSGFTGLSKVTNGF